MQQATLQVLQSPLRQESGVNMEEEVLAMSRNSAPFVWTHLRIASLILVVIDALVTVVVKGYKKERVVCVPYVDNLSEQFAKSLILRT